MACDGGLFFSTDEPHLGPSSPLTRKSKAAGQARSFQSTVVAAHQRLTAHAAPERRRTLVACSGGSDSVALVLALHRAKVEIVIGHVVHTMRPRDAALADRDLVRRLAERLSVPFAEADLADEPAPLSAKKRENPEAAARRMRYAALERMARQHGAGFVATAHHAEDQLESMLMALMRGSGSAGLRGLADSRPLPDATDRGGAALTLIRPMLACTKADAAELCRQTDTAWSEDQTNNDLSLLRNALRGRVLSVLEELRPGSAFRASRGAANLRAAHAALDQTAARSLRRAELPAPPSQSASLVNNPAPPPPSARWERRALRAIEPAVLAHAMRAAFARLTRGRGLDALPARSLDALVRAVRSESGEPKHFEWPGGVVVRVDRDQVVMSQEQPAA